MDDKPLESPQGHSLRYLEMAFRQDCSGRMYQPDGLGTKTGDCGDTVTFYLSVIRDQIQSIQYEVNGCLNTNACANAVIELAQGRTLSNAWEVTPEAVADLLESLPPDHFHCAELAVGAFYLALANCRELSRSGWKKGYLKH